MDNKVLEALRSWMFIMQLRITVLDVIFKASKSGPLSVKNVIFSSEIKAPVIPNF